MGVSYRKWAWLIQAVGRGQFQPASCRESGRVCGLWAWPVGIVGVAYILCGKVLHVACRE